MDIRKNTVKIKTALISLSDKSSLRPLLKDASQKKELLNLILTQLRFKKESHYLELGDTGATPHLASIGG